MSHSPKPLPEQVLRLTFVTQQIGLGDFRPQILEAG